MDARIFRTRSQGASTSCNTVASTSTPSSRHVTVAPRCSSTWPISTQSKIRGTLESAVRPGASSAAAMCFSAAFLAPETRTDPASLAPPVTRRRSIRRF